MGFMTSTSKTWLFFLPLLLSCFALGAIIFDLKHPTQKTDTCRFMGRGKQVESIANKATWLYGKGGKPENNIALECKTLGPVLLNEMVPVPIQEEQAITLNSNHYRWLPTRYHLNLKVINPTDGN